MEDCARLDPPLLEKERRLSESLIWSAQKRYFDRHGAGAWRTAAVPQSVTTHPALAHAYARLAVGYFRDCCVAGRDPTQPLHILELGAGSGRFAYLFLKAFARMWALTPFRDVAIKYVMSDFTATNLESWRAHPALRPFAERGLLDFARFDAENDRALELLAAPITLAPGDVKNPIFVIANYVFDGLPQDAFTVSGGVLHECLISISDPSGSLDVEALEPELFQNLRMRYTRRPAPSRIYAEPAFDELLHRYARTLDDTTILFPIAALRCMERLNELSGDRMLLVSADRGQLHECSLRDRGDPQLVIHGSFSMDVNYHALVAHAAARGDRVLDASREGAHLQIVVLISGDRGSELPETRLAHEDAIVRAGPADVFALRRALQRGGDQLDAGELLALIAASHWDPYLVRDLLPNLWTCVEEASEAQKQDLAEAIARTWDRYFHLGEERDLPFELALLLHRLRRFEPALQLFRASVELYGDDPRTRWNMGLCLLAAKRPEEAWRCLQESMTLDPTFEPKLAMQLKGTPP